MKSKMSEQPMTKKMPLNGIETPLNSIKNPINILFKNFVLSKIIYRIIGRFEVGIGSGISTQHSVLSLQQ